MKITDSSLRFAKRKAFLALRAYPLDDLLGSDIFIEHDLYRLITGGRHILTGQYCSD